MSRTTSVLRLAVAVVVVEPLAWCFTTLAITARFALGPEFEATTANVAALLVSGFDVVTSSLPMALIAAKTAAVWDLAAVGFGYVAAAASVYAVDAGARAIIAQRRSGP